MSGILAKPRLLVVAAIIRRLGRCLVVERPQGKPMAGYLEFPGGKVAPGESLEDALARELKEELGIEIAGCRNWRECEHEYPEFTVELHFFEVTDFSGEPEPLEGQGIYWLGPDELEIDRFLPADRGLAAELFN